MDHYDFDDIQGSSALRCASNCENDSHQIPASNDGKVFDMRHRLRIYTGEEEFAANSEPKMTVKLADMMRIIADASRFRRTWLNDFEDDEIEISADLYDVISAYWEIRPGA